MPWQDLILIVVFIVVWYIIVARILPKFGVGT